MIIKGQKFPLGKIVTTTDIDSLIKKDKSFARFVFKSLCCHARGDWGDLSKGDIEENELSLKEGFRLLSAYSGEREIWIITEADRSATTVLFPYEY